MLAKTPEGTAGVGGGRLGQHVWPAGGRRRSVSRSGTWAGLTLCPGGSGWGVLSMSPPSDRPVRLAGSWRPARVCASGVTEMQLPNGRTHSF